MTSVYVALGSNLGDRLQHLASALDLLSREPGLVLRRWSHAYESEPVGGPPQPRFLNAVAELGSLLSPRETLRRLLAVEEAMGRVRREKNGPREIDLDLLLFGDRQVDEPGVVVPHPRMWERAFVQVPLSEIAPQLARPVDAGSVRRFRPIRRPLPELPEEDAPGGGTR